MSNYFKVLTRKKVLDSSTVTETQLARVLNTFDLTALGVGSTLGVGVYVLAGHVAKETAGPAVVLSFLIAAIASVFAGLCYAEFGSRVPRAGSAYVYSYVCVGEFIAFIIGWNLILEYVIGSASVARGLSLYLDTLINHTLENTFKEIAPINVSFMSEYFDFFSCGLTLLLTVALAFGIKESTRVNNIFTILNIFVVIFVVIAGSIKANPYNWSIPESSLPQNSTFGSGGFFPYGFSGVIKGAATCFYGFVGFDCIATTGEEVKNPQRAIPLSIIASLLIIFLAYFGTATVITLMVPYFLQDIEAPIPHAFALIGWEWAKWIVAIGGIFGLCASLFGAMFPLPRIIYAMASDGIIFKFLGKINSKFHTPLIGTLVAGILTGLMSALFELKQLVEMMSIGTLLAYTIVAACVLLLRYSKDITGPESQLANNEYTVNSSINNLDNTDSTNLLIENEEVTFIGIVKQTFNFDRLIEPTKTTQTLVSIQICLYALSSLALGLCIMYLSEDLRHGHVWSIALVTVICAFMLLVLLSIVLQPTSKAEIRFKVPWVPLIPALSIVVNIYLMLMLDVNTWIRFGVWMAIGLPMYFICIRCSDYSFKSKSSYKTNNISNGHLNHTNENNGHINTNFLNDDNVLEDQKEIKLEDVESPKIILPFKIKPQAPSPPSEVTNSSSPVFSDILSVTDALAVLDDVLLKEENASFMYEKPLERKISIDTVSNISNVHSEESVVALIHCEDICDDSVPIDEQSENVVQSNISSKEIEQIEDVITMSENAICVESEKLSDYAEDITAIDNTLITKDEKPFDHHQNEGDSGNVNGEYEKTPNNIEDVKEISNITVDNEKYEDHIQVETNVSNSQILTTPPPPPPPMEEYENFLTHKIPRVILTKASIDDTKPKTEPSPDYSRKDSVDEEIDSNIIFGSKQHLKVMSKLNKFFEKQSLGLSSPKILTKPSVKHESIEQSHVPVAVLPGMKPVLEVIPNKNSESDSLEDEKEVVDEVMKPADIKKKLDEILKADPRLTMRPFKSNIAISNFIDESELSKNDNSVSKDEVKLTSDEIKPSIENEVERSNDTVASVEEVKTNKIVATNNDINAKDAHRSLMQNTLNSIKLRKLESLALTDG